MNRLLATIRCTAAPMRRRFGVVRAEDGFSLIEVTMAAVVLAILATALIGLLQSAVAANGLARQKTVAQQMAQDQVEYIRKLDYQTEIGLTTGWNCPSSQGLSPVAGIVPPTKAVTVRGTDATMTTNICLVDDPTLTGGFSTGTDYMKVSVILTSNRSGAVLTSVQTFVAPPGRDPLGGINNARINVKVQDMGLSTNNLVAGALVSLATGPSAPLSNTTDSNGLVTFAGLTANPVSGPQAYYDITATKSGYLTYVDDRVPGSCCHIQLAPSLTVGPQVIRLYKGATINVALTNASGNPYTSPATIKATSQRTGVTQTFTTSTGSLPIANFAGDPVVPGDFTLRAFTPTGGLCADPLPKYVPDNYPTTLTTTFTLQLLPCPSGTLIVNVTQMGGPAQGATVTIKDGPNDYTPISQTTNSSGQTTFTSLPSGTDQYNITVTDAAGNVTGSGTAIIATGATTTSNIALADPPFGTIHALVQAGGVNVSGATVVVTGGPYPGFTRTLNTNSSGVADFTNAIPAGSGYTVTATKGTSANQSSVNVTAGTTTNVTIPLPTATLTVTATWAGASIGSGTNNVTVTGGPGGGTYTGSTIGSGVATITVPQTTTAYPYTVNVSKNGGSGSSTVTSVPAGGASTTIAFTQVGTINVTTTWAGAASSGAAVSITGGPMGGTYTGTTNASGVASITVPTSATAYSVSAVKTGVTVTGSVASVATGSTNNLSLSFTVTFTINVKRSSTNQTTAIVKVSGGPTAVNLTLTGNNTAGLGSGGNYTISNLPIGTGYTYKAYANPCGSTNPKSITSTGQSVVTGQPTVNLVYNVNTCPAP